MQCRMYAVHGIAREQAYPFPGCAGQTMALEMFASSGNSRFAWRPKALTLTVRRWLSSPGFAERVALPPRHGHAW
jgi:hypothetical protein